MSAKLIGWAIRMKEVSAIEKLVLIILADRSDKQGWSYYSQETIGEKCGVTRKTVRTALQRLESAGLIRRLGRSEGCLRTSDHIQIDAFRLGKIYPLPPAKFTHDSLLTLRCSNRRKKEEERPSHEKPILRFVAGGRQ